jgi:homoserine O-acetyltransferase
MSAVPSPSIVTFTEPLLLACGQTLSDWRLAYRSWGKLDASGGNAILICHTLTADCHVTSAGVPGAAPGWWEDLVGPGKTFDTNRFFVLCINVLGGSHGSSGPATPQSGSGRPYGMRFPLVTVDDMVLAQKRLLDRLGIRRLQLVVGGCLGAMQALSWGLNYPDMVNAVAAFSARIASSPYTLALWSAVRRAIRLDPQWRNGDYYDGPVPSQGLGLANVIGLLHWMDAQTMDARYGRRRRSDGAGTLDSDFEIEHMFDGVVARGGGGKVDPNSMMYLTRAIDYFDLGPTLSAQPAGQRLPPHLIANYRRDLRYPPEEGEKLAAALATAGARTANALTLECAVAHGGFLFDQAGLAAPLQDFIRSLPK